MFQLSDSVYVLATKLFRHVADGITIKTVNVSYKEKV